MTTVPVNVKWNKQVFKDIELNTAEPGLAFKAQLYSLTKVPVDKQKIMMKGGYLKDDEDWSKLRPKKGQLLMMVGKAEDDASGVLKKPTEQVQFVEDLPEESRRAASIDTPSGLTNLDNTCYANSALQVIRAVPELREAMRVSGAGGAGAGGNMDATLAGAVHHVLNSADAANGAPYTPLAFVMQLRNLMPQFAERGRGGGFAQQDAEECLTSLLGAIGRTTQPLADEPLQRQLTAAPGGVFVPSNAVEQLLGGRMEETTRCVEIDDAPSEVREVTFTQLPCHIESSTNFLLEELKKRQSAVIEKHSELVGRTAAHAKESRIAALPYYLNVHFVRFLWKAGANGNEGTKCKIARPVEYPLTLDAFDLCSDKLKARLRERREKMQLLEDLRMGLTGDSKTKEAAAKRAKTADSAGEAAMDVDEAPVITSVDDVELPERSSRFENDTGLYDLCAVLTHKGRDADGGHYVSWVKQGENRWALFDDDKVSFKTDDDVKALSGKQGSDWFIAYICLYKSRQLSDVADSVRASLAEQQEQKKAKASAASK